MRRDAFTDEPSMIPSIVVDTAGCWIWTRNILKGGYALLYDREAKRPVLLHRQLYEIFNGPIPSEMTIDHLCRVRCCVNPAHMRVVDNRTNVLAGIGITAENARKTSCKRGICLIAQIPTAGRHLAERVNNVARIGGFGVTDKPVSERAGVESWRERYFAAREELRRVTATAPNCTEEPAWDALNALVLELADRAEEAEGLLPGKLMGMQAQTQEQCRCFLERAEKAERALKQVVEYQGAAVRRADSADSLAAELARQLETAHAARDEAEREVERLTGKLEETQALAAKACNAHPPEMSCAWCRAVPRAAFRGDKP